MANLTRYLGNIVLRVEVITPYSLADTRSLLNELCGVEDIPTTCIGATRRMMKTQAGRCTLELTYGEPSDTDIVDAVLLVHDMTLPCFPRDDLFQSCLYRLNQFPNEKAAFIMVIKHNDVLTVDELFSFLFYSFPSLDVEAMVYRADVENSQRLSTLRRTIVESALRGFKRQRHGFSHIHRLMQSCIPFQ